MEVSFRWLSFWIGRFVFGEPAVKSEASTLAIFCYKQDLSLQSQDNSKLEGAPKKPWDFLVDGEIKTPHRGDSEILRWEHGARATFFVSFWASSWIHDF